MMDKSNPSSRLWGEKPYYSLDSYLKGVYGEKVYKISLNAGLTCPNRDGTLGDRGCIFCSGGSGEFAANKELPIKEQISTAISEMKQRKSIGNIYIAYFQAYTNTYGDIGYLEKIYTEALECPDVAGISIATRPDCLPHEVLELLSRLKTMEWPAAYEKNDRKKAEKFLWIELGLQTIHEKTAEFIRRGYSLPVFEKAVWDLENINIPVIVHVILGLPGETRDDILKTICYLNDKNIFGIKLQLLHVLSNTDLVEFMDSFHIFSMEEYTDLVIECIERLSPDITIHRLTGDGPKKYLAAPSWSTGKRKVLNMIHKKMKENNNYQGRLAAASAGFSI